jgi:hypothetical protein
MTANLRFNPSENPMNPQKILPWLTRKLRSGAVEASPCADYGESVASGSRPLPEAPEIPAIVASGAPREAIVPRILDDALESSIPRLASDMAKAPAIELREGADMVPPETGATVSPPADSEVDAGSGADILSAPPQLDWVWQHQRRMSQLSLTAVQESCDFWRQVWQGFYPSRNISDKTT